MVKDTTPLRAHIVAARAYEAAWNERAYELPDDREHWNRCFEQCEIHRRAAEIMEAEAAKEEGGEG